MDYNLGGCFALSSFKGATLAPKSFFNNNTIMKIKNGNHIMQSTIRIAYANIKLSYSN